MCGITGHAVPTGRSPDRDGVAKATQFLLHRGPDGGGFAQFETACLGHRRLSVIDLEGSIQPWSSDDGRYTIVFNGEIYNYLELRKELVSLGFVFRSGGDTEVLLNMYIQHGAGCLEKLNGMFALAIWDSKERRLFVARDRVGKKPIYYACSNNEIFFASEILGLLAFRHLDVSIDLDAVNEFFAYQYIGSQRSIYRGIRKLPAGHYLCFQEGKSEIKRYWAPPLPMRAERNQSDLVEELTALVDDAVRLRLRSDVPLGAFLSGGIDSSIIVSSMKKLGSSVETFTVGFSDPTYDERGISRMMANQLSTVHHDLMVGMNFPEIADKLTDAFGEPFADPSALPTWYLCQHTRQFVTVALSGDGGDELFGGYRRYQARKLASALKYLPAWIRRDVIQNVIKALPEGDEYYGRSTIKKLKLFVRMMDRFDESPGDLLPQTFSLSERRRLFEGGNVRVGGNDHIQEYGLRSVDSVSQMMLTDILTSLGDDILTKVDRTSMAHSLEVRCPLLDYRIIEFSCRLPLEYKIRHGVQKYLLKTAYQNVLPSYVTRRQKHGFSVPISTWLRGDLKQFFESHVFDVQCPDFINSTEISLLWREHQKGRVDNSFKLWSILVFFCWYSRRARLETP